VRPPVAPLLVVFFVLVLIAAAMQFIPVAH